MNNLSRVKIITTYLIIIICFSTSCNSKEKDRNTSEYENSQEETNNKPKAACKFEDGDYSAIVDYNNSETDYSATYTLNVEVKDCKVVQINFPNDGYLDGDHISYADIDEDGNANVDGENGKTYKIKIDN